MCKSYKEIFITALCCSQASNLRTNYYKYTAISNKLNRPNKPFNQNQHKLKTKPNTKPFDQIKLSYPANLSYPTKPRF